MRKYKNQHLTRRSGSVSEKQLHVAKSVARTLAFPSVLFEAEALSYAKTANRGQYAENGRGVSCQLADRRGIEYDEIRRLIGAAAFDFEAYE